MSAFTDFITSTYDARSLCLGGSRAFDAVCIGVCAVSWTQMLPPWPRPEALG